VIDDQIKQLAEWLQTMGPAVVLTGAGMSTESGLPDFRSAGGLWAGKDPREIAVPGVMKKDYETFSSFYRMRITEAAKHGPNVGHLILAKWQAAGLIKPIVTQNVDGYHQQAGSKSVIELHGSLREVFCRSCSRANDVDRFVSGEDTCYQCGKAERLRPGIVLFTENLPVGAISEAKHMASRCKLFIVLGTSLQVYPAAALPEDAARNGAKVVIIDREQFNQGHMTIQGSIGDVLSQVDLLLA
jgi:NAD-dependent deacetylase